MTVPAPSNPERRIRPIVAIVAGVVTWLLAAGPLLGFAHYAFVKHGTCEHGELVHLDRGDEPTHAQSSDAHKNKAIRDSSTGHSETAHEHCGLPGFAQRQHTFVPTRAEIRVPSLAQCDAVSHASHVERRSQSILSAAPKTSPPAFVTAIV